MCALKFKFKEEGDAPLEAFHSLLSDLVASHRAGFPVLRTQAYYPGDLGMSLPNEFMIEVVSEDGLFALQRFLQNRTDVRQSSIQTWEPKTAMSPRQAGMWCHTCHAGALPLTLTGSRGAYSRR